MSTSLRALWLGLFAMATIASPAAACQYCRQGGDPQACLDLLRTDRSGELRLDAVIDKFQAPAAQAAPLTVATSAADLPKRTARRIPEVATPVAPAPNSLVDGALIGLVIAGGVFCWRTRRPVEALSR